MLLQNIREKNCRVSIPVGSIIPWFKSQCVSFVSMTPMHMQQFLTNYLQKQLHSLTLLDIVSNINQKHLLISDVAAFSSFSVASLSLFKVSTSFISERSCLTAALSLSEAAADADGSDDCNWAMGELSSSNPRLYKTGVANINTITMNVTELRRKLLTTYNILQK